MACSRITDDFLLAIASSSSVYYNINTYQVLILLGATLAAHGTWYQVRTNGKLRTHPPVVLA